MKWRVPSLLIFLKVELYSALLFQLLLLFELSLLVLTGDDLLEETLNVSAFERSPCSDCEAVTSVLISGLLFGNRLLLLLCDVFNNESILMLSSGSEREERRSCCRKTVFVGSRGGISEGDKKYEKIIM